MHCRSKYQQTDFMYRSYCIISTQNWEFVYSVNSRDIQNTKLQSYRYKFAKSAYILYNIMKSKDVFSPFLIL